MLGYCGIFSVCGDGVHVPIWVCLWRPEDKLGVILQELSSFFFQMRLIRQARLSSQRVQGATCPFLTSANTVTPEFLFTWWESNTVPQQLSSKHFTDGASFQLLRFPILGPAYLILTWCWMTAGASCFSLLLSLWYFFSCFFFSCVVYLKYSSEYPHYARQ